MKYLVLETITTIANNNNGSSHHNNNIENQPLRQDMNISKIFWRVVNPLELLQLNLKNKEKDNNDIDKQESNQQMSFLEDQMFSNPKTLIPYNRIEINANMPLEHAIQTLENGVIKEFNIPDNASEEDFEISIVSLHSTWDIRVYYPTNHNH
ncbi:hypothetical protein ACO0SA_002970 [Hanseniaspora valbyensis]